MPLVSNYTFRIQNFTHDAEPTSIRNIDNNVEIVASNFRFRVFFINKDFYAKYFSNVKKFLGLMMSCTMDEIAKRNLSSLTSPATYTTPLITMSYLEPGCVKSCDPLIDRTDKNAFAVAIVPTYDRKDKDEVIAMLDEDFIEVYKLPAHMPAKGIITLKYYNGSVILQLNENNLSKANIIYSGIPLALDYYFRRQFRIQNFTGQENFSFFARKNTTTPPNISDIVEISNPSYKMFFLDKNFCELYFSDPRRTLSDMKISKLANVPNQDFSSLIEEDPIPILRTNMTTSIDRRDIEDSFAVAILPCFDSFEKSEFQEKPTTVPHIAYDSFVIYRLPAKPIKYKITLECRLTGNDIFVVPLLNGCELSKEDRISQGFDKPYYITSSPKEFEEFVDVAKKSIEISPGYYYAANIGILSNLYAKLGIPRHKSISKVKAVQEARNLPNTTTSSLPSHPISEIRAVQEARNLPNTTTSSLPSHPISEIRAVQEARNLPNTTTSSLPSYPISDLKRKRI